MNWFKNKKSCLLQILVSCVLLSLFTGAVAHATSSADFELDFDTVTTGSEYYQSTDFQIQSGITPFETNSSSASFQVNTLNLIPAPAATAVCGNGIVESGEACDGANLNGKSCTTQGFAEGTLSCTGSCTLDVSSCSNGSSVATGGGSSGGGSTLPYIPPAPTPTPEPEVPAEPEPIPESPTQPAEPTPPTPQPEPQPLPEPTPAPIPEPTFPPATPEPPTQPPAPADPVVPSQPEQIPGPTIPEQPSSELKPDHGAPVEKTDIAAIIDPTPLIVSKLQENKEYTLTLTDQQGSVVTNETITTDKEGRYLYEAAEQLPDGYYTITVSGEDEVLIEEYQFTIRDTPYKEFEIIDFADNERVPNSFETPIDLGPIIKRPGSTITGRGIPGATVYAYFQSEKVIAVETLVNADSSCSIPIPDELELGYHSVRIVQIHPDGTPSKNLTYHFELVAETSVYLLILLVTVTALISIITCPYFRNRKKKSNTKSKKSQRKKLNSLLIALALSSQLLSPFTASAAIPQTMLYEGRLLDSSGTALTTAHTFRISLWKSSDWVAGDELGSGAINTGAANYGGWFEEHTITPNSNGTFSIKLGTLTALPDINFDTHKFLQIEVKASADPITSYQLLDPTGDNGADTTDRKTIGSVPYALNSEKSEKSNQETFTLDSDNTIQTAGTGDINLRFGTTLGKILAYDTDNTYFNFNDDVNINGDLTVTGTIEFNSAGNSIKFNATGLTADRNITFNDADTVVVGESNTQTLTNKTIDGDDNTLQDISITSLKDRNKTILLKPEYDKMTIHEDGTNNLASIKQGYDSVNDHIFYYLTSTQASLQDLDFYIAIPLPEDFQSFQATPLQIFARTTTTSAADNQIDISLTDTANAAVTLTGATDVISSVADSWIEKDITFGGAPTFTAGDFIVLRLNMQAKSNNKTYISEIKLNYVGK